MPNTNRFIDRIQDMSDFQGSLTNDYALFYDSSTGKFGLEAVAGGTPGGSVGQVQIHGTGGVFAGDAGFTFDATTNSIGLGGYIDFTEISTPGNPAAGTDRLWAESDGGFSHLLYKSSDGINYQLGRDNIHTVRNNSGATIPKGSWVYITGSNGTRPTVALARANSSSTTPVAGIAVAAISNNSFGQIMTLGDAEGINTSAFSDGDVLYLSATTAGAATTTPPTGSNIVERLGVVVKSSAGAGIIAVLLGATFDPATLVMVGGTQTITGAKTFTAAQVVGGPSVSTPLTVHGAGGANVQVWWRDGTAGSGVVVASIGGTGAFTGESYAAGSINGARLTDTALLFANGVKLKAYPANWTDTADAFFYRSTTNTWKIDSDGAGGTANLIVTGSLAASSVAATTRVTSGIVAAIAPGATYQIDAALGHQWRITPDQSFTLTNPANPEDGQRIEVIIIMDATGGYLLTLDTDFVLPDGVVVGDIYSSVANKRSSFGMTYDAVALKWYVYDTGLVWS